MAFEARHLWVFRKISDYLGIYDEVAVSEAFKEQENHARLDTFLGPKGAHAMIVFYQPRNGTTLGSTDLANSNLNLVNGKHSSMNSPVNNPEGTPEGNSDNEIATLGANKRYLPKHMRLFIAEVHKDKLCGKACWFIRRSIGAQLDISVADDAEVFVGVVEEKPLTTLEASSSVIYQKSFELRKKWGRCPTDYANEFKLGMAIYISKLQDILKSLHGGVHLSTPEKTEDGETFNLDSPSQWQKISKDPERVLKLTNLLKEWLESLQNSIPDEAGDGRWENAETAGPETDYWFLRMRRLSSVAEEVRSRPAKQVLALLTTVTKSGDDRLRPNLVYKLLQEWKASDTLYVFKINKAKDNCKYLSTLNKFIEPLKTGTTDAVIDLLPALFNALKMIHTIARYFSTNERMSSYAVDKLWTKDADTVIKSIEGVLRLYEAYQDQYRITKDRLMTMPNGKQFDFSEIQIFGHFDFFCRRLVQIMDMLATIKQFRLLVTHNIEGIEVLKDRFDTLLKNFKDKNHDLLDYTNSEFEKDYVAFNLNINKLEISLLDFINQSFESMSSIYESLTLLDSFQNILKRKKLRENLDEKLLIIFHNYGLDLQTVQNIYETKKHSPPVARNTPPVVAAILWARHLLKRIQRPMEIFQKKSTVLKTPEAKRIIRIYNKMARTLVAFEFLWYEAWQKGIDKARSGLEATLIVRNPLDNKMYVNFDRGITQLILSTKWLLRIGLKVPQSTKMLLMQQNKFVNYRDVLSFILAEHDRVMSLILQVTEPLLQQHIHEIYLTLAPGLSSITWTSVNIDVYNHACLASLRRMELLLKKTNDIIDSRVSKVLQSIRKVILVVLEPTGNRNCFTLEDFVKVQEQRVKEMQDILIAKSLQVETAVYELFDCIRSTPISSDERNLAISPSRNSKSRNDNRNGIEKTFSDETSAKVVDHYNRLMYQAVLGCTKDALNSLKKRVCSRTSGGFLFVKKPLFQVDVQLSVPSVKLFPSLDELQNSLNRAALTICHYLTIVLMISCFFTIHATTTVPDWGCKQLPDSERKYFFDRIGKDREIVRTVLMLTGGIQGLRHSVAEYLLMFDKYGWLWKDEIEKSYSRFMKLGPKLEDFEQKLKRFVDIEEEIGNIPLIHMIGALSLSNKNIKLQLRSLCRSWKVHFSQKVHQQAHEQLNDLTRYIKVTTERLSIDVASLDHLRQVMTVLKEVRIREASIQMEISPIMETYSMLEAYLPVGCIDKEEMDNKEILKKRWIGLVNFAEEVTDKLSEVQHYFKKKLLANVRTFHIEVMDFRRDFEDFGPMKPGLTPAEAADKLRRSKREFETLQRKFEIYAGGEALFGLVPAEYPELNKTRKELQLLDLLYDLYLEVVSFNGVVRRTLWGDAPAKLKDLIKNADELDGRCKKLPKTLRAWDAYSELRRDITIMLDVLPLLSELSKDSVKARHWKQIELLTGGNFPVDGSKPFKLKLILDAEPMKYKEDIEEIISAADKQMSIEEKVLNLKYVWNTRKFNFGVWKDRKAPIIIGCAAVQDEMEDSSIALQTMLLMRHVGPFKTSISELLLKLQNTTETLEVWMKVQKLWTSLEGVFTSGDIAKSLPREAKQFRRIDKDWLNVMQKSAEFTNVVAACSNNLLIDSLPILQSELEKCQKSLSGYLENKRYHFPRFYFVSNPMLLQILSQGNSNPHAVQPFYENLFDSISKVGYGDDNIIKSIISRQGDDEEIITLNPKQLVKTEGNIEKWLLKLQKAMQFSMKTLCKRAAFECGGPDLRAFVDSTCGQFALLGLQLAWTATVEQALSAGHMNGMTDDTTMTDADRTKVVSHAVQSCLVLQSNILSELSSWCIEDLGTSMNRQKIETMITIQVHQRDVFADIAQLQKTNALPGGVNNFEWSKQCRIYWRPGVEPNDEGRGKKKKKRKSKKDGNIVVGDPNSFDEHGPGCCQIEICDVAFKYGFEYLGCKDRLVITPLTDRAYITLSQALGLQLGGAPAGPAGTGKTETVKDLGRTLGLFVLVTNCTSEQRYSDMAKIFKGLCLAGLWGCFDEFNRIKLPVLSVVAQQILAITSARRAGAKHFNFPEDPRPISIKSTVGYFITMNPGYAGRQELPENLKALFRSVAMMVPDREMIIRVKLCAVGYRKFTILAKKFRVLYELCEKQLSQQKHYDFGLRNILSVLRTAGRSKRQNPKMKEEELLMRSLRDMNLSKFVAADSPLFLSLLQDLFPDLKSQATKDYKELESAISVAAKAEGLMVHDSWKTKTLQLYETTLVRHAIMLVGPAGSGKTTIFQALRRALGDATKVIHKEFRLFPKAIFAEEMFGEFDAVSGEWVEGVFAKAWSKFNDRGRNDICWMVCDGPVDANWIENLNTVMDDNKILTLANGDRIPMTENVKLMFETESLKNASPATVSRTGIIYVSDVDVDWMPLVQSWLATPGRHRQARKFVGSLLISLVGDVYDPGHLFLFINASGSSGCKPVSKTTRVGAIRGLLSLLEEVLVHAELSVSDQDAETEIERIVLWCIAWSIGGVLNMTDREKLDEYLRQFSPKQMPPTHPPTTTSSMTSSVSSKDKQTESNSVSSKDKQTESNSETEENVNGGLTIFDYQINMESMEWELVLLSRWSSPSTVTTVAGANEIIVPTLDSTRTLGIMELLHTKNTPMLITGGVGTSKTTICNMFLNTIDSEAFHKRSFIFSSSTTASTLQKVFESNLEKRGGRSFSPTQGKSTIWFLDDISMPEPNEWGDQPTLEIIRQVLEIKTMPYLDVDKRGEMKLVEGFSYLAAMSHAMGGKNEIPLRLKSHFFIFNIPDPDVETIMNIYGQLCAWNFSIRGFGDALQKIVKRLIEPTVQLWKNTKTSMLPTPTKFHYNFNLRDLSRIFNGMMRMQTKNSITDEPAGPIDLLLIWRNECQRVLIDKLVSLSDQELVEQSLDDITQKCITKVQWKNINKKGEVFWVDFLGDDIMDDTGENVLQIAPKIYEPIISTSAAQKLLGKKKQPDKKHNDYAGLAIEQLRLRVGEFLELHNKEFPSMLLVLFDDALRHLVSLTRLLGLPRGNALLVGVGGSGKQSMTQLAAYISRQRVARFIMTNQYTITSLYEDLRALFRETGGATAKSVTWLIRDSDIIDDTFMEVINAVLVTGEVPNLFAKDELLALSTEVANIARKEIPGWHDTTDNAIRFFYNRVRANLHVVLNISPMHPKFREWARCFPGIISSTVIDWYLEWPEEALVEVSRGLMKEFDMPVDNTSKEALMLHLGKNHSIASKMGIEYYNLMRRRVYQTPQSFLVMLTTYKKYYTQKQQELDLKEKRVTLGLEKLMKGAEGVEKMKMVLKEEEVNLVKADEDSARMLGELQVSSVDAQKEEVIVQDIREKCYAERDRIQAQKEMCEKELELCQPLIDEAESAVAGIDNRDLQELKKMQNPSDVVKLIFDIVLILRMQLVKPVEVTEIAIGIAMDKVRVPFLSHSYDYAKKTILADIKFLKSLQKFSREDKDDINDETVELMEPYLNLPNFNPATAKNASNAAEGLCVWACAMAKYQESSKVVKPRLDALASAQIQLEAAEMDLGKAESRYRACKTVLLGLQTNFEETLRKKAEVQQRATQTRSTMDKATALIRDLSGERTRWSNDAKNFAQIRKNLIGDCSLVCSYMAYAGPFNQQYRNKLWEYIQEDIEKHSESGLRSTTNLDIINFLSNPVIVGNWQQQGLPTDKTSTENALIVTQSDRTPLLIDPQGQAFNWIMKYTEGLQTLPHFGSTTAKNRRLKDHLNWCLQEGLTLIVAEVDESLNSDPIINPVLDMKIVKKGRSQYIDIGDSLLDYNDNFRLFMLTRIPNPNFSPELQARTSMVDFTVTMKGLEEQLLGNVIQSEQRNLEIQLKEAVLSVMTNTKSLIDLDSQLLSRLTSNAGNLLEDDELIGVLADTKRKANAVTVKISEATLSREKIAQKREQYRPVATRGSVLYFSITDMLQVNPMYQTSLGQFLRIFTHSMNTAKKFSDSYKRVCSIIDVLTQNSYVYFDRGLYVRDKLPFKIILILKMLATSGEIQQSHIACLFRLGSASVSEPKANQVRWLSDSVWQNIQFLSSQCTIFKNLTSHLVAHSSEWFEFFENDTPELLPIPSGLEEVIQQKHGAGTFFRMLLLRAIRPDRCLPAAMTLVSTTTHIHSLDPAGSYPALGTFYTTPVVNKLSSVFEESKHIQPVIFLLSAGSDPTEDILDLARRKKVQLTSVSMGAGQEEIASRSILAAAIVEQTKNNGNESGANAQHQNKWVLLQNCHLMPSFMSTVEGLLDEIAANEKSSQGFRLWITAMPSDDFPIGLLQMSIKVACEPPPGIRAGMMRSYAQISQDKYDSIDSMHWQPILFSLCFLHSVVQERRKYGSLGWNIPYEFSAADQQACLAYIEKSMSSSNSDDDISWKSIQFMIGEVHYGGKITDDFDRRLMLDFVHEWISPTAASEKFHFSPLPKELLRRISGNFVYAIPKCSDVTEVNTFITSFPKVDSPELFGLHPNAELKCTEKTMSYLMKIISETQPKVSNQVEGSTREDQVLEKCAELKREFPEEFDIQDCVDTIIGRMGGFAKPLNVFLRQEIVILVNLMKLVKASIEELIQAVRGEIIITPQLSSACEAIYDSRPPQFWIEDGTGREVSWRVSSLSKWVEHLKKVHKQLSSWLMCSASSPEPTSFWLAGFFNPRGFLTSVRQTVTRRHKNDKWSLDEVVLYSEVTEYEDDTEIDGLNTEGVYVSGLQLEGCAWDRNELSVMESFAKQQYFELPYIYISCITQAQMRDKGSNYGPFGGYECPCYKYKERTDQFYVFSVMLASSSKKPGHWARRGAALLLNTN